MTGSIAQELKEIMDVGHELIADDLIQRRHNMDGRLFPHAGQAVFIAAGNVSERFNGDPQAGSLKRMNQRTGNEQVMSEAAGFLIPDIFRKGSVMAENDVAKLACQRALDKV